jgi:hypothetical protein
VSGGNVYSAPVNNGTFSVNIVRCATGTLDFTVLGVDYATLQQSAAVGGSGTTGTVNVGTIQACGTSSAEYIEFLVDGNPITYTAPPDSLTAYLSQTSRRISGIKFISPGTYSYSGFDYTDRTTVGTTALTNCYISSGSNTSQQILTASPVVNITAVGPVTTGFIEGNFNVQMNFSGTTKTVACTFRVRRY